MAVSDYNFDVPLLIESVKNRPCLWDKTDPTFKDRYERHRAWLEICEIQKKDFDKLDSEEQKQLNDAVTKKWNHVRDAFLKSVKRRQSNPALKEYIYHRRLQFLTSSCDDPEVSDFVAVAIKEEEEDTLPRTPDTSRSPAQNGEDDDNDTKRDIDVSFTSDRVEPPSKVRRLHEHTTPNHSGQESSSKSTPDEDEAFYISISPLVKRMTDNEKLEFKIGVLNLIKNIRQKQ